MEQFFLFMILNRQYFFIFFFVWVFFWGGGMGGEGLGYIIRERLHNFSYCWNYFRSVINLNFDVIFLSMAKAFDLKKTFLLISEMLHFYKVLL